MKQGKILDIGVVVKSSGMSASTLRFYEEKGLIKSVGRVGLRRQFSDAVLKQLSLIALGKQAGFSLSEMAAMLATDDKLNIDKTQLQAKVVELDQYIDQLTAMRNGLTHAINCQAPSHLECPNFNRLLKLATRLKPQIDVHSLSKSRKN